MEISKLSIQSWSSTCPKQVGEKDRRGEFIKMTELLPKSLAAGTLDDDQTLENGSMTAKTLADLAIHIHDQSANFYLPITLS